MGIKLKPCPFCGGAAEIKHVGNEHTKKRSVHIDCSTFGCTVQIRVAAITQSHNWCKEKAIEKWNTRATPAGTIITDKNRNRPPDDERAFYRSQRHDGSWGKLCINSGWVLNEGECYWPIGNQYQAPEQS